MKHNRTILAEYSFFTFFCNSLQWFFLLRNSCPHSPFLILILFCWDFILLEGNLLGFLKKRFVRVGWGTREKVVVWIVINWFSFLAGNTNIFFLFLSFVQDIWVTQMKKVKDGLTCRLQKTQMHFHFFLNFFIIDKSKCQV